jgi:putative MFS transporter
MNDPSNNKKNVIGIITVAALGYFVDVYDLILFSVVRKPSLLSLGITGDQQIDVGVMLAQLADGRHADRRNTLGSSRR